MLNHSQALSSVDSYTDIEVFMITRVTSHQALLPQQSFISLAHSLRTLCVLVCAISSLTLIGCNSKLRKPTPGPSALPAQNEFEQEFDLNNDNKPDVWRHYVQQGKSKLLSHKSFDLNFDGRVDFKRFYTPEGKVIRDEFDMDFDGQVDRVVYYKNNVIERKEVNLQGDKRPEVIKHYKNGQLYILEEDRDADRKLDHWEHYRDGKLARRGYDRNNDGKPDFWEELD